MGNSACDWLQLGPVAASAILLALAVTLGQSASGAAMPTFTFDDLLLWSETLDGEDRSAAISQEGKAPDATGPNGPALTQPCGTAISRVQNRYNLSVPNVFFSDLALPTVPQSQRDTLIHVASPTIKCPTILSTACMVLS